MGIGWEGLPSTKKWMQTTTLEERLRAAAGSTSAVPPARDVVAATMASLDGAASVKDKVAA